MAVDHSNDGRRGIGALLRDLAEGSAELVRDEVRLARIELGDVVAAAAAKGTAFAALGGVLVLLGTMVGVHRTHPAHRRSVAAADLYWVGALLVFLITGGVAAWFAKRGRRCVSPSAARGSDTVATLKEDKEWLKQRLTSGATSS